METRKLEIACPTCGSRETCYTCTPNCCFNHVCGDCGTTFEPVTKATGGGPRRVTPPDPLPDASDPTAECVCCGSTQVYIAEDESLVCGKCGAGLELELTEIAPA